MNHSIATQAWLATCGLDDERLVHWWVEAQLQCETDPETHLELQIRAAEWRVTFRHAGRTSSVRVADEPRADPADDHGLLSHVSTLDELGRLVRALEERHAIVFRRYPARIWSNLRRATPGIRAWISSL